MKSANQGCGFGAFSETGHVTFERNILRNVDMGFNLAADPTGCAIDMHDILIRDNVCEQCGPNGDHGNNTSRNFLVLGATHNLTIMGFSSLGPNMHTAMEITPSNYAAPAATLLVENVVFRGPTGYGLRNRPINNTYSNYTFTNAYAVGDNCQKFVSGWSCPSSVPAGMGANMSAISSATAGVVR